MANKIPFHSLVTPNDPRAGWHLGNVVGMSEFHLSIGPLLHIRNLLTGELIKCFPMSVDRLVRAS